MLETPTSAKQRALIWDRCAHDQKFRQRVIAQCKEDSVFFINAFIWSFDPRPDAVVAETPFILYPFQVDLIRKLDAAVAGLDDLLIEKSRDMGGTWTIIAWAVHGWLFRPGWQGLLGSRKEKLVDDRTIDSHFGKIDFILRHLPGWFLRDVLPGFREDKHRQKLKLVNPSKVYPGCYGNALKGESSNEEFGRAGRQTFIFFDEAAFFKAFSDAWRAAAQTTRTRIGLSTPRGMNAWGRLIHRPENQHRRVTLHWRLHPLHDDAWYARECKRLVLAEDIAQELDLNYQRSTRGLVYPQWEQCEFGVYDYNPKHRLFCSWDFGLDGTALIWWQRDPVSGQVTMLDAYEAENRPLSWFIPFVKGELPEDPKQAREYTPDELAKITVHSTWGLAIHYGDPSVNQRNVKDGKSPADLLKEYGIFVFSNAAANDFKSRRRVTLEGLRTLRVNLPGEGAPVGCEIVDDAMRLAKFQERDEDSQSSNEPNPVHDGTSHLRSSVEFFYVNLPPHSSFKRPDSTRSTRVYDHFLKR